jgi:hypothetical protein
MALNKLISLAMSGVGLGLGVWLTFFPGNYVRAYVRYAGAKRWLSVKPWLTAGEAESPRWHFAFRLLGCGVLAFTGVYIYAVFYSK